MSKRFEVNLVRNSERLMKFFIVGITEMRFVSNQKMCMCNQKSDSLRPQKVKI